MGISFQQVQKYENGSSCLAASTMHNMSRILECHLLDFFEGVSTNTKPCTYSKDEVEMLSIYESLPSNQIRKHFKTFMKTLAVSKKPRARA